MGKLAEQSWKAGRFVPTGRPVKNAAKLFIAATQVSDPAMKNHAHSGDENEDTHWKG